MENLLAAEEAFFDVYSSAADELKLRLSRTVQELVTLGAILPLRLHDISKLSTDRAAGLPAGGNTKLPRPTPLDPQELFYPANERIMCVYMASYIRHAFYSKVWPVINRNASKWHRDRSTSLAIGDADGAEMSQPPWMQWYTVLVRGGANLEMKEGSRPALNRRL